MSTGDKLYAYSCTLATEDPRKHAVQGVPTHVPMSITRYPGKVMRADALSAQGAGHLGQVLLDLSVDLGKTGARSRLASAHTWTGCENAGFTMQLPQQRKLPMVIAAKSERLRV